jgi:outer membrane murein-binding lipoprotein Lpp
MSSTAKMLIAFNIGEKAEQHGKDIEKLRDVAESMPLLKNITALSTKIGRSLQTLSHTTITDLNLLVDQSSFSPTQKAEMDNQIKQLEEDITRIKKPYEQHRDGVTTFSHEVFKAFAESIKKEGMSHSVDRLGEYEPFHKKIDKLKTEQEKLESTFKNIATKITTLESSIRAAQQQSNREARREIAPKQQPQQPQSPTSFSTPSDFGLD